MTTLQELGRLEKVDLRTVWSHEALSFTPWLAKDENLRLLGETIGVDLELDCTEKNVGPYYADILCKATGSMDHWVLIENQIERTDHSHLGQLLTYAAGLHAATIVWVAKSFTDEHRAALQWLNEVTHDNVAFFGLEVELWRIGNSIPAPKFNVVARPNEFVKQVQEARHLNPERAEFYFEYWSAFKEFMESRSDLRGLKPNRDYWYDLTSLAPGVRLHARASQRDKYIMVDLSNVNDPGKQWFDNLVKHRERIDAGLLGLNWRRKDQNKESGIELKRVGPDPNDRDDWPNQHAWLVEKLEAMRDAFAPLLRELA